MIDLHCHILPGVDDGPKTLEEAIAMAKKAVKEGIEHILVTPHHRNGQYLNIKSEIVEAANAFQVVLDIHHIPLSLYPGQEVRLTNNLIQQIEQGEIQFIDELNQYVLIEFPTMSIPNSSEYLFFNLRKRNITPVIVHPERNQIFMKDLNRLSEFIEKGALAQLTAGSYTGKFGKKIQKVSKKMLKNDLVHVIASDAHNITSRDFNMKKAYELLGKEFGVEKVNTFKQTAKDLINGDSILFIE